MDSSKTQNGQAPETHDRQEAKPSQKLCTVLCCAVLCCPEPECTDGRTVEQEAAWMNTLDEVTARTVVPLHASMTSGESALCHRLAFVAHTIHTTQKGMFSPIVGSED